MLAIKAKGLTFKYAEGDEPVIRDVNLEVEKGELVLVTGPSGCGKTTLCRCFNGLIPHFYEGELKGEVEVCGLKVVEHPIHKLAQHVCMVFQEPENQLFCLTVERELAFGPENLGLPREEIVRRVEEVASLLGIKHLLDKPPYELSGGEQQRVAIGAALTLKPTVLILDEPTSNLDPKGAKDILSIVKNVNKELGITVVLVEHRLDLAAPLADRVIVMVKGSIALDGAPRDVLVNDLVEKVGIGTPKLVVLYKELLRSGVKLRKVPLTVQELEELLGAC
ncbi:MAG: ATP-binding cassette domain-containing protein [Candidatus Nezhaarchaeales archaeon]